MCHYILGIGEKLATSQHIYFFFLTVFTDSRQADKLKMMQEHYNPDLSLAESETLQNID